MPIPDSVVELITRYENNLDSYRGPHYNEAQVRQEFINPFFAALGWDVDNAQGFAEAYKDVVHEDAIKIGGVSKAPDYSFRIGGTRKFFLEAKKPAVVLKFEKSAAYQLRRYAWSAKLPLSLLTNFAEFAVYDCRIGPEKDDQPSKARLFYFSYKEYAEKWDEIVGLFSKTAILKGSFDKFAESSKGKRGTAEVDVAFLAQIETWRDQLARSLALRNPDLSQRDLNFAVQRTIDRIVFLRICEDRGMEPYGQMQALLNGANAYPRLCELFQAADDRYNSGLFHFQSDKARPEEPDGLTLNLGIDDKTLKDILRGLYYPDSPYVFSVIPADILGQAYEQFLGKVIRLTPGHRAIVEDKPEVKKAGGVYYTPTYIVEYIVRSTLGKLLADKTPKDAAKLRVLDPACGSGSFLIGAFQYLLDWHRDWYVADGPAKHKKELYEGPGGVWRLNSTVRKTILRNSIYGVDIDAQAVEVTKLSLLLKVLEGESAETLNSNLKLFKERALPDLGDNIKCGNSLIGPDFFDLPQAANLTEELFRVNPFDWQSEFKSIMQSGGFDAVIGNPPWGGNIDEEISYFHMTYPASSKEHTDSFKFFVDKAISLCRKKGLVTMIVPNSLLRQTRTKDVRRIMLQECVTSIVDLGDNVFKNVVAPSCIFNLVKEIDATQQVEVVNLRRLSNPDKAEALNATQTIGTKVSQVAFENNPELAFVIPQNSSSKFVVLLGDLQFVQCKDAGINYQRVKVGMQQKGNSDLATRLLYEGNKQSPTDEMYWKGSDIDRYTIADVTTRFCRTNYQSFIRSNEVVHLNDKVYDQKPKILIRQTSDCIIATLDSKGVWFGRSIIALVQTQSDYRMEFVLGLLNSRYLNFLYSEITHESGRVFAQVKLSKLKLLPIRTIDFGDLADKAKHDKMVEMVEKMLQLHKELPTKSGQAKTLAERQIAATDAQIDRLVYDLYGLTEDEIKIVEGA